MTSASSSSVHTKTIDEQIVTVIFPEHLYLTRMLLDREAIQEETKLDSYAVALNKRARERKPQTQRNSNCYECGKIKFIEVVALMSGEIPDCLDYDNKVDRSHSIIR